MQAGANVIGCVVNKQRRTGKENNYYYYYSTADEQDGDAAHRRDRSWSRPLGGERITAGPVRKTGTPALVPGASTPAASDTSAKGAADGAKHS